MAEPGRLAETFHAAAPMDFGGVRLLVIERSVARAVRALPGLWYWCDKSPHALVIQDRGPLRALGADALPVPLDRLYAQVPGLDALLATL